LFSVQPLLCILSFAPVGGSYLAALSDCPTCISGWKDLVTGLDLFVASVLGHYFFFFRIAFKSASVIFLRSGVSVLVCIPNTALFTFHLAAATLALAA
jgi:hypothetical protein